jgi:DNA-binding protein HU-beta
LPDFPSRLSIFSLYASLFCLTAHFFCLTITEHGFKSAKVTHPNGFGRGWESQNSRGGRKGMNKSELVEKMAKSGSISKAAAEKTLGGMLDAVTDALKKGDKVTLVGFGTFSVTKRAARQGRNPQTGKPITIKARKVARFKAGSKLADTVK